MKKTRQPIKPRTLELKKETVALLTVDQLKEVAGGNKSTVKSQCATLCF